jgi:hypothetical protein
VERFGQENTSRENAVALLALSHPVIVFPVQRAEFAFDLPDLSVEPSQLVVASLVVPLALCKP